MSRRSMFGTSIVEARSTIGVVAISFIVTALFACATPTKTSVPDAASTEKGPTADLAGFVTPTPDLAPPAALTDMAVVSHDMTQALPADMSTNATSACGSITYAGVCAANVLEYCLSNAVSTIDCSTTNRSCKVNGAGDADCHFVAGTACGQLTSGGVCDGNTVAYCSASKVKLINCDTSGSTCDDSLGFADCF